MLILRALLVSVSMWMACEAQLDMSLLSKVLPRDTFIISNPGGVPNNGYIVPRKQIRTPDGLHRRVLPLIHRQQQRPTNVPTSASRFSVNQQVPSLPIVPPRPNVPQTQFFLTDNGSPVNPQTIPQNVVPSSDNISSAPQQPENAQTGSSGSFQPKPQGVLPFGVNPVNPQQNPIGLRRHPMCGRSPPVGDCRAAFPRYHYNPQTDQCDCFLYGGCGDEGLQYSYSTLEECVATCLPSNTGEGPVCEELFYDDGDVFFDPPVENSDSVNHITPKTDTGRLSEDDILYILVNSVSPQELAARESNRVTQRSRVNGNISG